MRINFFALLASLNICFAYNCTFIPPTGWELGEFKDPSPFVKMSFLGKGSTAFRPSINLALEEEVDVPLKEYVKAVKELQTADRTTQFRDLGVFPMTCGNGRLIELTNKTPFGETKVLQVLFVKETTAYILTAAVLKEEFPKFQQEILKAFRSLNLTESK